MPRKLELLFTCADEKHPIRKTTFMLGENGTGKSALLKAIAIITSGSNCLSDILGNPDEWIKTRTLLRNSSGAGNCPWRRSEYKNQDNKRP